VGVLIGGYQVCLLDTNAASAMAKRPERELRAFLRWSHESSPAFVPALSVFTLVELRDSPAVYRSFVDLFDELPCFILKSYDLLVAEEARVYPRAANVDPFLAGFRVPGAPLNVGLADTLKALFSDEESLGHEERWKDARVSIIDGIRSLVANYPPKGRTYTPRELRTWLEIAGFSQIAMYQYEFARERCDRDEEVLIDAFPSVKAVAFTVFHKFYVDPKRTPHVSDAFDLIIASPTPYVDAVITENHQAEVWRKTKNRDPFIDHVQVLTLGDLQ
jgi:hypothetical protein